MYNQTRITKGFSYRTSRALWQMIAILTLMVIAAFVLLKSNITITTIPQIILLLFATLLIGIWIGIVIVRYEKDFNAYKILEKDLREKLAYFQKREQGPDAASLSHVAEEPLFCKHILEDSVFILISIILIMIASWYAISEMTASFPIPLYKSVLLTIATLGDGWLMGYLVHRYEEEVETSKEQEAEYRLELKKFQQIYEDEKEQDPE